MPHPVPGSPEGEEVRAMFDRIAPTYDRLNRILSLGIDCRWRRLTIGAVAAGRPRRVLDVATGTGDLAIGMARRMPGVRIDGIDLSEQMIRIGRGKAADAERKGKISPGSVGLQQADALALPFPDDTFDAATVAFGVRNFSDIAAGLREMHRVLSPGGSVYVLEFSRPRNKIFGGLYRFYSHRLLPFVGARISRDGSAYRYLPDSIDTFPDPERFREILSEAGFRSARTRTFTFGIAHLHQAIK